MTDTARVLRGLPRVLAGRDLDRPGPPPGCWRRIVGLGWPLGVLALIGLAAAATQYLRDTRAGPAGVALSPHLRDRAQAVVLAYETGLIAVGE